jgi:hypothetical protein
MALQIGIGWYTGRRRRRVDHDQQQVWQAGWAIRRDWPGTGHDFVALGLDPAKAQQWCARDAAYWRRGPVRPTHSLVQISERDFRLHHRHRLLCKAPDCPSAAAASADALVTA